MTGGVGLAAARGAVLTWDLGSDVSQLLSFHFMVNALRAGTVIAVAAGVIGWFMILRRQSFVGHTLAVVAFPGAAGATLVGLSATVGYFGASLVAALLIALAPRAGDGQGFSEESAVVGTVQAFALACGFLFVSLYKGFLDGVTNLLFGSFLGITDAEVLTLLVVGLGSLAVVAVIGRPLFFASVDPSVAAARGVPVRALSVVFLLLLGVAAAEVSQVTGALLVFALLVMPAAAARQVTPRPGASLVLTVAIGLLVVWLALGVAYFSVYPVGFFVTSFGFAAYVMAVVGRRVIDGRGRGASPAVLPALPVGP